MLRRTLTRQAAAVIKPTKSLRQSLFNSDSAAGNNPMVGARNQSSGNVAMSHSDDRKEPASMTQYASRTFSFSSTLGSDGQRLTREAQTSSNGADNWHQSNVVYRDSTGDSKLSSLRQMGDRSVRTDAYVGRDGTERVNVKAAGLDDDRSRSKFEADWAAVTGRSGRKEEDAKEIDCRTASRRQAHVEGDDSARCGGRVGDKEHPFPSTGEQVADMENEGGRVGWSTGGGMKELQQQTPAKPRTVGQGPSSPTGSRSAGAAFGGMSGRSPSQSKSTLNAATASYKEAGDRSNRDARSWKETLAQNTREREQWRDDERSATGKQDGMLARFMSSMRGDDKLASESMGRNGRAEHVESSYAPLSDRAADKAAETLKSTGDKLNMASDAAKDAAESFGRKASAAGSSVKESVQEMSERASDAFESVKDTAASSIKGIKVGASRSMKQAYRTFKAAIAKAKSSPRKIRAAKARAHHYQPRHHEAQHTGAYFG